MKRLSALAITISLLTSPIAALASTEAAHSQLLKDAQGTLNAIQVNKGQHSFCYVTEDEDKVRGINAAKTVRLASTMKLMTSLWALWKLGPDHRYKTVISYSKANSEIHISGSRDPFFDRDRLYLLLSDLKRLGITRVQKLTADRNFFLNMNLSEFEYATGKTRKIYYQSEMHTEMVRTDESLIADLKNAFDTEVRSARYGAMRAKQGGSVNLVADLEGFQVDQIGLSQTNNVKSRADVIQYVALSRPLQNDIKIMNLLSSNPYADELFHSLGGRKGFKTFLETRFEMGSHANGIFSGSGVELEATGRVDTTMNCAAFVSLVKALDVVMRSNLKASLDDVAMIAGVDSGTWSHPSQAFVVKTGTLTGAGNRAKNLAGYANTKGEGRVYFGIFIQTENLGQAANGIREIAADISRNFGGTNKIVRAPFKFDTLDKTMALSKFNSVSMRKP